MNAVGIRTAVNDRSPLACSNTHSLPPWLLPPNVPRLIWEPNRSAVSYSLKRSGRGLISCSEPSSAAQSPKESGKNAIGQERAQESLNAVFPAAGESAVCGALRAVHGRLPRAGREEAARLGPSSSCRLRKTTNLLCAPPPSPAKSGYLTGLTTSHTLVHILCIFQQYCILFRTPHVSATDCGALCFLLFRMYTGAHAWSWIPPKSFLLYQGCSLNFIAT